MLKVPLGNTGTFTSPLEVANENITRPSVNATSPIPSPSLSIIRVPDIEGDDGRKKRKLLPSSSSSVSTMHCMTLPL